MLVTSSYGIVHVEDGHATVRIDVNGLCVEAEDGNVRAIEESKRLQRIDELFNILKGKREVWKQLHPGRDFPGGPRRR